MHLIEVLMAGSVFAIASGSSLQLWSATAVRAHQLSAREQLEQLIEQDRVQLQTLWRSSLESPNQTPPANSEASTAGAADTTAPNSGCSATAAQLEALASNWPIQPPLRRQLHRSSDGLALQMQWSAVDDPHITRTRLVTPAGLGLCSLPPTEPTEHPAGDSPLTDSQMEEVPS